MRLSYGIPDTDDKNVCSTADHIVDILVRKGLTYQQASDALTVAQERLSTGTRPISVETPRRDG